MKWRYVMFWFKVTVTALLLIALALLVYIAYTNLLYFTAMMAIYGTFCFTVLFLGSLIEVWMVKI